MFNDNELLTYLNDKIVESKKSPYSYAICNSYVETKFAKKFDEERLYFVVETKGKSHINLLREEEIAKIKCAKKHFEALGEKIEFMEKARDVFP